MMKCTVFLPVLFALGCAQLVNSDCPAGCDDPFVCTEVADGSSCRSDPLDDAACDEPPDLDVPLATLDDIPVRWAPGPCVRVSYDPALSPAASAIAEAVDALNAVECSTLCLDAPSVGDAPDLVSGRREIHLRPSVPDERLGQVAITSPLVERSTGRIFGAEILLDESAPFGAGDYLSLFLSASGLGPAPTGTDSLRAPVEGLGVAPAELRPADMESFCTLYGPEPLCD